ncbi:Nonribosomal peptide synthetase [Colletotrichum higginsianum IMI 349063]|uniref:Nonribosomal peptide synthetase n=1 Tax=Colletotrichum higginsianum (strain IMI 349063) TaxID=759273 RepID=A0A1B7Y7Q9_COLHI|nr:Nonribosomal peptide synthetase [Colletotrichum higginsianum IMI 349063]OBR08091.1 Nonribosomal peptide synthetase [Colletotrichum higginsianum IMI 349063]
MNAPQYGKRLIPQVLDEIANTDPDAEIFSAPRSSDPKDGWKKVTYWQVANAVNRIAQLIVGKKGRPEPGTFPTLTYIGPSDVRYAIITIACIKAGYKALLISPRNSHKGQMNLLEQTDCNIICCDSSFDHVVQPLAKERQMDIIVVSSAEAWLEDTEVQHFPYIKTFEEAKMDPVVVLHTSGSTGLPKPVVLRVAMVAVGDAFHNLPDFMGSMNCIKSITLGERLFLPMPLFHAAGCCMSILSAIYWKHPVALGFTNRPLTPQAVLDALQYANIDNVILPPSILEEMASMPEGVDWLKKMKRVHFGGGNLARDAGDLLTKAGVPVSSLIASTETGVLPYFFQKNLNLWQWFIIDSDCMGVNWRQITEEEDIYEQIIVRKDEEDPLQGIFYTFPEAKEYSTKDLYCKHPTLPNHWRYYGRADNIITLSNGEKLNPLTIEEIVTGHPRVKGAIVAGAMRFQPLLIIEPIEDIKSGEEEKLIDDIWPLVVKANKETVAHGQISRQFISVTSAKKPFPRAGKGTIQRHMALKLYNDEINEWYKKAEDNTEFVPVDIDIDITSQQALTSSIEKLFQHSLGSRALSADTDFFNAGIDSMQIINASRILRHGLKAAGANISADTIATRVIYGHPTPRQLSAYLIDCIRNQADDNSTTTAEDGSGRPNHDVAVMESLIQEYTRDLPQMHGSKPAPNDQGQTILITGTTGSLGSYMLDFMESNPAVTKVICLNRSNDGYERQMEISAERGLNTSWKKTEFLCADLSKSNLGLKPDVYNRLLKEADRIIHNAWPVNFNISLETFKPHIRGVRHFIDFSLHATKNVPIIFISSIGTVNRWAGPIPVPEEKLEDLSLPTGGYGRSKLVSSLILDEATQSSGVPTAIVRVGQIAGPQSKSGCWNRQEWLPSIVASSVYLGILPKDLGDESMVNWTPVEGIANLILEVSGIAAPVPLQKINGYFHGVNPRTIEWEKLAIAIKSFYGDRIEKLVSFKEWSKALEESASLARDVEKNPGIKLLDFYQDLASGGGTVKLSMERTMEQSKTMKEMQAVTPELVQNWCRQWGF